MAREAIGEGSDNVVRLKPAAAALRDEFIGWQCRLRQLAVREAGGRPSAGMRPRVTTVAGAEVAAGIVVLIVHRDPDHSTRLFRHQVQKTPDPIERYDKALEILAASHFQHPREFSDVMPALFGPASALPDRLLGLGRCGLDFAQYGQGYRLPCTVDELAVADPFYQATYWHNSLYNPNLPPGLRILAFTPDWTRADRYEAR